MKKNRVLALVLTLVLSAVTLLQGCDPKPAAEKRYLVGISQIVSHPLLDSVRQGFIDRMTELGYVEGKNITYDRQNAQGQVTTAQTIAQKFAADNVDLMFPIGTATSQTCAKASSTIPIIFGAVTDPESAGLVKDPAHPGANITGLSDLSPFADQLKLLVEVAPNVKTIGMVYNSGEANSAFGVSATQKAAESMGLQVKTAAITSTNEIYNAAQSLANQVDAFYSGTDNTVVSALETLIKVAEEKKKPLLAADPDSVQRGAVVTLGVDYKRAGAECANMADKILKGTPPGSIPVMYAPGTVLAINTAGAQAQGVTIPQDLLSKATVVYQKKEQPGKP